LPALTPRDGSLIKGGLLRNELDPCKRRHANIFQLRGENNRRKTKDIHHRTGGRRKVRHTCGMGRAMRVRQTRGFARIRSAVRGLVPRLGELLQRLTRST
jgi:hypothetical protein